MNPANIDARQTGEQAKSRLPKPLFTILRYGLAVLSVSVALGAALLVARFNFRDAEVPLFLFAVAVAAWYGGAGAALLALILACLSFDYFFTEPFYTLDISLSDLPYFLVFALFAALVTWFSIQRRRVEQELRQARDELEIQVAERTQQASLLNTLNEELGRRTSELEATNKNWRHLLIPYRMTFARPFAIRLGLRNCFKEIRSQF